VSPPERAITAFSRYIRLLGAHGESRPMTAQAMPATAAAEITAPIHSLRTLPPAERRRTIPAPSARRGPRAPCPVQNRRGCWWARSVRGRSRRSENNSDTSSPNLGSGKASAGGIPGSGCRDHGSPNPSHESPHARSTVRRTPRTVGRSARANSGRPVTLRPIQSPTGLRSPRPARPIRFSSSGEYPGSSDIGTLYGDDGPGCAPGSGRRATSAVASAPRRTSDSGHYAVRPGDLTPSRPPSSPAASRSPGSTGPR
jgi:hypothetical protein